MAVELLSNASLAPAEFTCTTMPEWGLGVGILMGTAGSIGINVGQNIQAMGIKELDPIYFSQPWRSKRWQIGLVIFILFCLINFGALALAPASILVPIESLQFVTNVVWNNLVNKIRVGFRMQMGVLIAIIGTCLSVAFGAPSACHSPADMMSYWGSFGWWVYLAFTMSISGTCFAAHRFYRRRWKLTGVPPPHPALLPVCYSIYCSLIGGAQVIVHSKAISVLLAVMTEDPISVWTSWLVYVELFLVVATGCLWGLKLTECLTLYDPLIIIPLMVGTYIAFGGIAGGVFFQEFTLLHEATSVGYWGWLLYVVGMLMVLIGLAYIADASISPAIVAAVTDDTGGGPGHREGDAWPARPHGNFDGVSPGDRPDVDHRRASISRALTTGGLDLPRLQTDRVLPGERLHERARDERHSREYTHSRDNMINELMHPKGSLLPRPFAMIGMAPNNDNRAGPSNGLHRAKTSGDLRGAETHDGAHDGRPRSPRKPLGTSGVETGGTELSPRNKPMKTAEYETDSTKVEELSPEMKRHNGPREDLREAEPGRGDGRGI
jgi:hypothetical protein